MGLSFYLLICVSLGLFTLGGCQLPSSQISVLLQIRKHLEYPSQLEVWSTEATDICYSTQSLKMNVTCSDNAVIELRIMGDKPSKISNFDGYPIASQTLSEKFSMDSFVTTLTRLTNLRVLSLVSLGIWGPFSTKIHRLTSLEYLDLSSNFIYGSIPPRISTMTALRTLIVDGNFLNDTIPDLLGSFPKMEVLSLTNNQLKGPLPTSIGKITTLTILVLSNNEILGKLPDLSGLNSLKVLDLSGNKVGSNLPKLPRGLIMAFLGNSSFTGDIPRGFKHLNNLQHLDMSLNQLRGNVPTSLFFLTNISYLNLASNSLTGSLPYHLKCGKKLSFVDISNNRITGIMPRCLTKKVSNFLGNCLTGNAQHQHPRSYCSGESPPERKTSGTKKMIVMFSFIGVAVLVVALLAFLLLVMCRRYCSRKFSEKQFIYKQAHESIAIDVTPEILANARLIIQPAKYGGVQTTPMFRMYSIDELKEATNDFEQSAFLGEGSKGKMYKGKLKNGTQVAIRCFSLSHKYTSRNLKVRLDLLAKIKHPHLISLLGYCIENDGGISESGNMNVVYLVHEYAENENLRSYLYDKEIGRALNWSERLAYLVDIAKAVHFLHAGVIPGFFNNRLKLHNILLDENRRAKLSDYGLSVISDDSDENMAPGESKSQQMTVLEDDIYRFGFILLESIIGPSVSTKKESTLHKEMAFLVNEEGRKRMVDPLVLSSACEESLSIIITITSKCLSCDSSTRPSFEDVLWNLQYAAQIQASNDAGSEDCLITTDVKNQRGKITSAATFGAFEIDNQININQLVKDFLKQHE
ncbi:hypothetical protein V2J09_011946 [Rumex salicifolius]